MIQTTIHPDDDLKLREEKKRDAAWDPVARWNALHEFIEWAEKQFVVTRSTPSYCKAKERILRAGLEKE